MKDNLAPSLQVSIRDLPSFHVACIVYKPGSGQDTFSEIHQCFQAMQAWVREQGIDPLTLLHIGVPEIVNGQLSAYLCGLDMPASISEGSDPVSIRELPGGRYAVLSLIKESATIGPSIGRFYQEYMPENHIEIDGTRPTYEIYYESTMEYCVPIR